MAINNTTGEVEDTLGPGYVERHAERQRQASEEQPTTLRALTDTETEERETSRAMRLLSELRALADAAMHHALLAMPEEASAREGELVIAAKAYAAAFIATGGSITYRGCTIRLADAEPGLFWSHDSWEPGDLRCGWAATVAECLDDIDERLAEHAERWAERRARVLAEKTACEAAGEKVQV